MVDKAYSVCYTSARESLGASVSDGKILLMQSQDQLHDADPAVISLFPDQIPMVIEWLQTLLTEMTTPTEA